jgi:hypothetical protein
MEVGSEGASSPDVCKGLGFEGVYSVAEDLKEAFVIICGLYGYDRVSRLYNEVLR